MPRRRSLQSYLADIKLKHFQIIAAVRVTMPGNRRIQFECMVVRGESRPVDWLCGKCRESLILRKGHKCKCGARVSEIVRIIDRKRLAETRERVAEMYWREIRP